MYLKRLDVQGFKSFANKTALQFGTGVTCVVGPNGTGKTNVADSLRWVLGEHASRTLRARKTEDVIFAGSDKRAPMGMAEVSITLDNSGQWLPIDYDEVVVTRRAYRSGENDYLINNTKVRLRDVIDLFLRAQVGQNSYAFMGQGMVEQVLSLRPEDRRGLIEEAADVRLYRNKLEDAQHKLRATRENMERVRLLVGEIEPRITQLERQAGRAVKYRELTSELAGALHAWFAHQWQEVNAQLLAAITTHDQRSEQFERARATVKACEDGLVQLRAAITERRGEISIRDERLRNLQDYVRDLDRRAALDAERARMLAARIDELTSETATLREDLSAQKGATPERDTAALEAALEAARETLAGQRARLAAVDRELQALQRTALTEEEAATRARVAVEDLSRRVQEAEGRIASLRADGEASTANRRQGIAEIASWAREYAHVAKELSLVSPRLEWALNDRASEGRSIEALARERGEVEQELRTLRSQIEAIEVRLDLMAKFDMQPQARDAGVRALLEAGGLIRRETVAEDVEINGVLGLVGQLLRVPPGYERALEAALAENLYAVVFAREVDMRAAMNLLLSGDGHATMYALDSFQEHRPLNLIKEKGVVGVASGMVRCDSKYRRLIDTLLGRVVVVEDLRVAERVVRRGLAGAVATLDGVLLRPVGSVSAGTSASVETSFVYARELDDLPAELERLRPAASEREARAVEIAARLDEAEQRSAQRASDIDELREQKSRLETVSAALRERLAGFGARLRSTADGADHAERLTSLMALQDELSAERERKADEARGAQANEQAARASLRTLAEEREALAALVEEETARLAHRDGELRAERSISDGDRAMLARIERQIAAKEEQLAGATVEAREVGARLASTRRDQAGKTEEVAALAEELDPARRELAQFESRERELTAQLAESNEKMRGAERALVEAEHEGRARQEELDSLRRDLTTEGLVATADGEIQRAREGGPEWHAEAERADVASGGLPAWLRSKDVDGDSGLPSVRGGSTINPTEVRDRIAELRGRIRALGPVNDEAANEYAENRERYDFLSGQLNDLKQAEEQLNGAIAELEAEIRDRFRTTFKQVNQEFERYFNAFFRGGTARLELGEADEYGLPGIEIVAQPPGKKLGSLALLSGGERSLTAVALLFALLQANPSPICVLDEVDAALDEANVGRFVEELRALAQRTQFIIITHNRRTIETADTIYGVSMAADSVSRVLSLRLADVEDDLD